MNLQLKAQSRLGWLQKTLLAGIGASGLMMTAAHGQITTVFYILLENRCFTSGTDTSYSNILFQNKNGGSPYLTSLCTPNSNLYSVNYQGNVISQTAQSSFCSAYHNAFATTTGTSVTPNLIGTENANTTAVGTTGAAVHPSEPNYVFMEAGSNLSKLDDNDPYLDASQYTAGSGSGATVEQIATFLAANPSFSGENLSALLQNAGISWTSYTEGTCLLDSHGNDYNAALAAGTNGTLTNNISPLGARTVPMVSFSGTNATYVNPYNGSNQFNFAAKHTGQLFFPATMGGTVGTTLASANLTPSNPEVLHYAPLEQLASDLASNTQAAYSVITPDQYNDGHTALSATFSYKNYGGTNSGVTQTFTGGSDLARVAQMDNFCAIMVPEIMASPVYQSGHAAIVIWTDETEGSPQNDFYHTLTEIVISPASKGNAYNSTLNYTHSSDVATMQKIFGVVANTASGYLNDAVNPSNTTSGSPLVNNSSNPGLQTPTNAAYYGYGTGTATDLADLFVANTIPSGLPPVTITPGGYIVNARAHTVTQTVTLTNPLSAAITNPVYLVLGNLSHNTSLSGTTPTATIGSSSTVDPGSPYINAAPSGLAAGASVTFTLHFAYPSSGIITDVLSTVSNGTTP